MSMNIEAGIRDLKRRVSELEGPFGFPTRQVQNIHKDLLAFEEKTEQRFNTVDQRFDQVESKLDSLDRKIDTKIDGLAKALSGIVGEAVREATRDKRKPR
jgi:predicted  nucleic acid-binding Zn-ribbon protein